MGASLQTEDVPQAAVDRTACRSRGAHTELWPIRYKPLPDELLSSWLVRLAHGHGLKVQTFCNLIFGNRRQVWNRDIDRLAPDWLVEALALHTGTPIEIARRTTLKVFEGTLYPHFHPSGTLLWIQTMKVYHRQCEGLGQQYCPACLSADTVPYFRKTWRVSLKTFCLQHGCYLLDRCHACRAPVAFHRVDMDRGETEAAALARCHRCGEDLSNGPRCPPRIWDEEAFTALSRIIGALDSATLGEQTPLSPSTLAVLRHLGAMLLGRRRKLCLRAYLSELFAVAEPKVDSRKRPVIESQGIEMRHTVLAWSAWLLCSPTERIEKAIAARAVQFNHFLRDLDDPPQWYLDCIQQNAGVRRRESRGFGGETERRS
ncbi:TniQ family protein [Acidovorax sp. NCPPB 4044]|uniref:TniQ family protein n=1 Tax=Acidovorax sp. NCPPB 4044 TaxID=2940490 RepID=UPI002304391B|nr:TniQ family protein [Acidovorax sp. NCPPB 4044]MDA8522951.1 TniQ family protein [Acidovorax sp. NCPPB 4044]